LIAIQHLPELLRRVAELERQLGTSRNGAKKREPGNRE